MRIAITGGTGFVGRHLIDSLIGIGHAVFLISRREVPSTQAGVTPLTWHGLEQDVSVPGAMMRLLFGEMADLLLKGQKIEPVQALQHGFVFEFGTVEKALRDLVGK